jgi:RNA recognition motif-containing protein
LDYKVDEKKLKEVFRLAGKVVSAELSLDKEGKSRGFGVVEYEHPVEAVQAICILFVRFYYVLPDMGSMFMIFMSNQVQSGASCI